VAREPAELPGQLEATRSRRAWARCSEAELEVRTSGEALGVASAGFGLLDAAGRGGGADGGGNVGGIGSIGSEAVPPDSEPAIANRPAILPLFDDGPGPAAGCRTMDPSASENELLLSC
jgi:hypothetical protein